MKRYPDSLLEKALTTVYLVSKLKYRGTAIGGSNSRLAKALFIDAEPGSTNSYLTRLLHHEMTHLITSGRGNPFPYRNWAATNRPGFQYGNGGLEAIKAGTTAEDGDVSCREQGFARPYAMSGIAEDVACTGEMLFTGDSAFWQSVDRFTILRAKVELLCSYLHTIEPSYSEKLFRLMPSSSPTRNADMRSLPVELVHFPDGGEIVSPQAPAQLISVQAGGAALFPAGSGVQLSTGSTLSAVREDTPPPGLERPMPPNGSIAFPDAQLQGWLYYAQGRAMVRHSGYVSLIYRAGDLLYFPFGGQIWDSKNSGPTRILSGRTAVYQTEAVVVFNPRLRQE